MSQHLDMLSNFILAQQAQIAELMKQVESTPNKKHGKKYINTNNRQEFAANPDGTFDAIPFGARHWGAFGQHRERNQFEPFIEIVPATFDRSEVRNEFHTITAHPEHNSKSLEELRLEQFNNSNNNNNNNNISCGFDFGSRPR